MSIPTLHTSSSHAAADDYVAPSRTVHLVRMAGLLGGPLLAVLVYFIMPDNAADIAAQGLSDDKLSTMNLDGLPIVAAVAILMGIWWMTEAIPLAATALIPMVVFPALQVDSFPEQPDRTPRTRSTCSWADSSWRSPCSAGTCTDVSR